MSFLVSCHRQSPALSFKSLGRQSDVLRGRELREWALRAAGAHLSALARGGGGANKGFDSESQDGVPTPGSEAREGVQLELGDCFEGSTSAAAGERREVELEIPPWGDTLRCFGSFVPYFGPEWLVCNAAVDPGCHQADNQSVVRPGFPQGWVTLWTRAVSWHLRYACVKP